MEDKVVDITDIVDTLDDVLKQKKEDEEIDYLIDQGRDNISGVEMTSDIELARLLQSIEDTGKAFPSAADLFTESLSTERTERNVRPAHSTMPHSMPDFDFMDTTYDRAYLPKPFPTSSSWHNYGSDDDIGDDIGPNDSNDTSDSIMYAVSGVADKLNEVHETVKSVDQQLEDLYNRSLDTGDKIDEQGSHVQDIALKVLMLETTVAEIKQNQVAILAALNELSKKMDL